MSCSRSLYVNLSRLAMRPDEAGIVLRLMMVFNDLSIANSRFGEVRAGGEPSGVEHARWGAGMYFLRLQIGHLNEALAIIKDRQQNPVLSKMVADCSLHAQDAFARWTACLEGGPQREVFMSTIAQVRHTTVFHYDHKLVKRALEDRATRRGKNVLSVTSSNDIRMARFGVADAILDTLTCRFIWKAKEVNVEEEIGRRLDFGYGLLMALLEFSMEFAMRYIEKNAAL